jgi:hypothetical protein
VPIKNKIKDGRANKFYGALKNEIHSRTTEIYTHVSTKSIKNVKSPFDDLRKMYTFRKWNFGHVYGTKPTEMVGFGWVCGWYKEVAGNVI